MDILGGMAIKDSEYETWKAAGARDRRAGYSRVAAPSDQPKRVAWHEGWKEQDAEISKDESKAEAQTERICANCEWWDKDLRIFDPHIDGDRAPCRGVTPSIGDSFTDPQIYRAIWPWSLETERCPAFEPRHEKEQWIAPVEQPPAGLGKGDET